jgi:hypothetical protein
MRRPEWGWLAFCAIYIIGGAAMLWVIVSAFEDAP